MKKIFTVLVGTVLLASVTSAFAGDPDRINCPYPSIIRDNGSHFTSAFLVEGYDWTVVAEPFNFEDQEWQTTFTHSFPNVMDSGEAVKLGAYEFSHTPLLNNPASISTEYKTECIYTPARKGGPIVTVSTPAKWGFKKA